ncbi:MAG TPA: hypothetical protein PLD40_06990 [Kiritimatiellia bacterium]|jgi:hypothetical protein|nr:MAG: hypothetical protein BWX54_00367 [Verrucomicrobia bacterium ADurb.Bin018]HOE00469.1 hypothetical protein [Kiritimatiellia bacterium]HOE37337.1 hypothetical protein [Kiritimatiellia bacterium]HOR74725.1 hypothetical protein [Kiritimatiellia bacterium]HOU59266.1 hypothetical protein [Kiritimatiellia bacterium]
MELALTIAGWISVALLGWFIWQWLAGMVRGWRRTTTTITQNVNKDLY